MSKETVKTIDDIARIAKVSKSTVSRALNDSPLVNQETRARIQTIAREHSFNINVPARNLSLRSSKTIAYVSHAIYCDAYSKVDLFGLEIMGSVGIGLHKLGYDFMVVYANPREIRWAHQYISSGRVDGFILVSSVYKQAHLNALAEIGAPHIVWGSPPPKCSCCSVAGDNLAGGRIAAEYLINTGRQSIAFLGGPAEEVEVKERLNGFETALHTAGRGVNPDRIARGDYSYESGVTAMQRLLKQNPDLDAVFVTSDLMAVGAINAVQDSGKRVPEDIAVVGYDNLSIASYNCLPLTTIGQNVPLAGRLLAQNLIQFIQTGVVTHVTIPVELIVRKSA